MDKFKLKSKSRCNIQHGNGTEERDDVSYAVQKSKPRRNSKPNWPLPPYAVFRCRPVTPWIIPDDFTALEIESFYNSDDKQEVKIPSQSKQVEILATYSAELERDSCSDESLDSNILNICEERGIEVDVEIGGDAIKSANIARSVSSTSKAETSSKTKAIGKPRKNENFQGSNHQSSWCTSG